MNRKLALSALLLPLASYSAIAEEIEVKPEYSASAELGFLYTTGNTKSADIKAGFNLQHEKDKWLSVIDFNILVKKLETEDATGSEEFETTDNKWDILAQTNYTIGEKDKNYLYGNFTHEQDKFSSFESQSSVSAGLGRHWYETEKSSLFTDVGPGVTYDVIDTDPSDENTNLILQAQLAYSYKFNEFVEFKQYLVAKQAVESGENSFYKSESSITAQLIDALQLKFSIRIEHDTEVEAGFEDTNTETSMTLIYNF